MIGLICAFVISNFQNELVGLEQRANKRPGPANFRALAYAYVEAQQFQKAADAFSKAGTGYRKTGDLNAAKVLEALANRYRSSVSLYVERPAEGTTRRSNLAKWEPLAGCYLGVNIDREDEIQSLFMDNDQIYRDPQYFNTQVGKHHAIFFTYLGYGRNFPRRWAEVLKRSKAAAQIAWEPHSLSMVQNDRYLRRFAEDAHRSGIPIFLRFASEMNGSWTFGSYGGDPGRYIRAFRTVAQAMHDLAPNVAMVWCPNETPEDSIRSYYPGEDAVDWVGVNFYSVLYNDGDRARAAEWRNPIDALDYIYRQYSMQHPIMVGEWAATHRSVIDSLARPDFAITKINQFYRSLPLKYPRVKAVSWLSMNTIKHAEGPRKLNDFSLLSDPSVSWAYRACVQTPYFIDQVGMHSTIEYRPLKSVHELRSGDRIFARVRCYDDAPTLVWKADHQVLAQSSVIGSTSIVLTGPPTTLQVNLKDRRGRAVLSLTVPKN